jgi:hypothetical protein
MYPYSMLSAISSRTIVPGGIGIGRTTPRPDLDISFASPEAEISGFVTAVTQA